MIQQFSRLALTSQDYLFSQLGDSQLPSQFNSSPEIDRLDCLMIQNFKSFDKKYVGPFLNFTSIIGPNGSGKSNILDALMFCFCSQNSRHSLIDARQLINRQGKQTFKQLSKQNKICSVQATFKLKNGQKFVLARTLDAEGKQDYLINYTSVGKKLYQNVLLRKGINCNTPNYAIWQGEIDRLVLKDPGQLTALLENLSGSIYFKKPYEEIRDSLKQIQTAIEQKTRKINKLKIDRKNLKSIKHTSEQYNKYDNQYQQLMKKIYYLQVLEKQRSIEQLAQEVQRVKEEEKKKMGEINEMKANAQRDWAKKMEIQGMMDKVMAALADGYAKLKDVGNPANVLKVQKLKEAESSYEAKLKEIQQLKTRKMTLEENIPQIPSNALIEEYLGLYQKWQSENNALHRQISKKKNELLYIEGILQSKSDLLLEFENKKLKNNEKKQTKKRNLQIMKQDLKVLTQSIKAMESQNEKVSELVQKNRQEYEKKNKSYEEICASIQELESLVAEQAQDQKQGEMLKNLASIDGFYGALHQKIKPGSSKYDICFSLMLGKVGKYLLCQSQDCSRRIGNRLKQIRLMKNVIILDNVLERRSNDIRKSLGKDAVMGIDIVDFDQETKRLKQYLSQMLYGKVVCDTLATAYKIRNKEIQGVKEIYTLDGNVIRKDGVTSTYGNPDMLKKTHKFTNNKTTIYTQLSNLAKQKIKIESQLHNLRLKFDQKSLITRNLELHQLVRKKQTTLLKIKQLENQQDKEPAIPQNVINEIRDLERQRDKLGRNLGELEKMIRNSKIFQKFMAKNGVDSLQAFRNANNFEHIEALLRKKNEITRQLTLIDTNLQKLHHETSRTHTLLSHLKTQLLQIPQKGDKSSIEHQISENQKQLVQLRNKLSKLTQINRTQASFQSVMPNLEARLGYAKQKIGKELEDFAYEIGVQYKYPVEYEEMQKALHLPKKVTSKTIENLHEKLQTQRQKIQQHLNKHNTINLLTNVQEDQQKIEKNMNSLMAQIDEAIKQRKRHTEQLQRIRKDRAQVLINFVTLLRENLGEAYKILTEQDDGTSGAINLHVENEDQPFQHGIYFTPTPPTKRFVYDLEQLSGGERSIASLALQYSLSLASKSPILILDETDAFLDVGNVTRFVKLINNSLRRHRLQIIIVTHKQGLFSKSESLVGVSRPKSVNLSQVYSLKLLDD